MAINGKHTTGLMIFPRAYGASVWVYLRSSANERSRIHKTAYTTTPVKEGARRAGMVSLYARAYHSIRSPALGLLNATCVHLPRTLGVYLSIHLSEGRMDARGRGEIERDSGGRRGC